MPDEELEMTKFLEARQGPDGVGLYQYHKLTAAVRHCKQKRVAVDIGAHCGLWSMHLAKMFKRIYAFEPVERHRECFYKNVPAHVDLFPFALGNKEGVVRLAKGVKSTGDTHISPDGEYEADLKTLDSFHLTEVDFIKLDCEGYELFALKGGKDLINACRPVICVEQKPGKGRSFGLGDTEAVKWLQSKGYKLREMIDGDYILS